jgi:hypothetical protein
MRDSLIVFLSFSREGQKKRTGTPGALKTLAKPTLEKRLF